MSNFPPFMFRSYSSFKNKLQFSFKSEDLNLDELITNALPGIYGGVKIKLRTYALSKYVRYQRLAHYFIIACCVFESIIISDRNYS